LIRSLFAVAVLADVGMPPIPPAGGGMTACMVPADPIQLDFPLWRMAYQLASGDLLRIVALGSSSTAGAGASSAASTYPSRLLVELARLFPSRPMLVLNRGVNGELAIDMLARFDESVAAEHPNLVLWQLGTNAVLRSDQRSLSDALIRDGVRRTRSIGTDIVLIDPQYAPKLIGKPQLEDMVALIASAARKESVDLFPRFALMRHWHEVDGMPFEGFVSADGLHMNDWSYACMAKALAAAIAGATMRDRSRPTTR